METRISVFKEKNFEKDEFNCEIAFVKSSLRERLNRFFQILKCNETTLCCYLIVMKNIERENKFCIIEK